MRVRWWRQHGWPLVGLPLLLYGAAAAFMTWPLVTQLSTHIGGGGFGDSFEYVRLGWWGKYALQNGLNPFYQSLLGYPEGFVSATQIAQPLIYWPTALFGFFVDPVAAFNLWLILIVVLNGLAAYWLCLAVVGAGRGARIAALLGGLVFMAFPAAQGHLSTGHINPLSNYALPVVALCLFRIVERRGGLRTALLGAAALGVLALGNFTAPVFLVLPLLLFGGLYRLLRARQHTLRWDVARRLAVMLGGGALLMVPFYWPLVAEALGPERPAYLQEGGGVRYSTDPLAFVAFSPFVPWMPAPDFSRAVLGTNSAEGAAYLGIVAAGLAVSAVARRRGAGLWLAIALGCMLFSLGPLLKWEDRLVRYTIDQAQSHIVLPWALFQDLPLINVTRTPGRFNITAGLMLGVLAALGLQGVLARLSQRGVRIALGAGLAALILAEYQLFFPFPTIPAALPAYFHALAARDDVRAVFDVPWDDPVAQKDALYQQTAHHKPLVAGYVSRGTAVDPAKLALLSDAALGKAVSISPSEASPHALQPDEARVLLKANGIDVVVYHWALLDRDSTFNHAVDLFGPPAYADDRIAVFEVPDAAPSVAALVGALPATFSAGGWWRDAQGTRWLREAASLYVYAASAIDVHFRFEFTPLLEARRLHLMVDGQVVRAWEVAEPGQPVDFWQELVPGFHTLRFIVPEGCTALPVAPACLLYPHQAGSSPRIAETCRPSNLPDALCVSMALRHSAAAPAGAMAWRPLSVTLSEGVTLRGFRVALIPPQGEPGSLRVDTTWHAARRLPGDYHLFVHVLDSEGKPIGQADTVPGGGTFPTDTWSAPQVWSETVSISLPAGLPAGAYRIYTGWYRYPDLTRLGVAGDAPGAADGLVFLHEFQVSGR